MQQLSKQPAFELGQIVATPGALAALKKAGQQPGEFLTRHVNREWGDLSDEDRKENDYSLEHGFRLLSAYRTHAGETTTLKAISETRSKSSFRSNAGPDAATSRKCSKSTATTLTPISSITARSTRNRRLNHDTYKRGKHKRYLRYGLHPYQLSVFRPARNPGAQSQPGRNRSTHHDLGKNRGAGFSGMDALQE